jgi:hypothetical protein
MMKRLITSDIPKRNVRPHFGEGRSKTATRFREVQEGIRADSKDKWAFERLISARRAGKRRFEVLVRWAGEHPDTWENPSLAFGHDDLLDTDAIGIRSKRRRVLRFARAALGPLGASPYCQPDPRPSRLASQPETDSAL